MTDTEPDTQEPAGPGGTGRWASWRSVLWRLVAIGPAGIVRLAVLSLLTGLVMIASDFSLQAPHFDAGQLVSSIARTLAGAASWLAGHLWKPLLTGSLVVIPVWILWRLVSLPFRK